MARLSRLHNPRSLPIWPGLTNSNTPGDSTPLSVTTYSIPVAAGIAFGTFTVFLDTTAGVTGTYTIQGTLVPDPELTTDVDWVTLTPTVVGSPLALAGAAATTVATITGALYEWNRVKYTHTSGGPSLVRAFARVDNDR